MKKTDLKERKILFFSIFAMLTLMPVKADAMHIMEGYLEPRWCIAWGVLTIPFIIWGFKSISESVGKNSRVKLLLAMAGAFTFMLSALKIPSVTGSCSHPTGVAFGAILFGPAAMSVIGLIVLLFQAVLLAHGGLTTLGANTFSMAVVGPFVAYFTYRLMRKWNLSDSISIFTAAFLADLLTYVTTSFQLALAFPSEVGGFMASLTKFMGIFAVTQIPLAISEGILTVLIFSVIKKYSSEELRELNVMTDMGGAV